MPADDDAVGHQLNEALDRLIRRASLTRVHQRLRAAAGINLDRSSYWLASWLAEADSLRLSDLAHVLYTDLSTVSRQVQAAERAGLIARRPDPLDGRATRVYLSPAGRSALERVRAVQRSEILSTIADWSPNAKRTFTKLMSRFASEFLAWALGELPETPSDGGPSSQSEASPLHG